MAKKTFDDSWAAALRQTLSAEAVLPKLIAKLLRESGITLSTTQIDELRRQIVPGRDKLTINVDDAGYPGLTDAQAKKRASPLVTENISRGRAEISAFRSTLQSCFATCDRHEALAAEIMQTVAAT